MTTEYITHDNEQFWLDDRALDVTSTESAALFAMSPYTTELELWHRKAANEVVVIPENQRMKAGKYLEPAIAHLAGSELGCDVLPFKVYARDPGDRMGSSFDFSVTSGKYNGWLMEVKNVDYLVYRDNWHDDEAPDHIEVQGQHQLELTQRPGVIFAVLVGGNDLRLIERERDPKMGAAIRKRIRQFWQSIAEGTPPEPDFMRDAEFLISLHQAAGENVAAFDEGAREIELIREYKRLKNESADLDKIAQARKAELLTLIGDDVKKVIGPNVSLACGMTKSTPPTVITEDMLGQEIGGRRGYRQFRVTIKEDT